MPIIPKDTAILRDQDAVIVLAGPDRKRCLEAYQEVLDQKVPDAVFMWFVLKRSRLINLRECPDPRIESKAPWAFAPPRTLKKPLP